MGAKGLGGAMRVELLTDWPERLSIGAALWVEAEDAPRQVLATELGGRVPVLRLDGIDTREAAEALVGRYLEVEARSLPPGTYYWHQLVGLTVTDPAGGQLGTLEEVFRVGENEVYRVVGAAGELLVPALRDVVQRIDLEAGVMVVDYAPEEVV
ncbi:MAG: ribosome maturation factor RimM [Chloroflexota bacterium]|nr:ribosome maturation factor RimM [Chloroflexota bacterium]